MDELEEHAFKHSSHLARTDADIRQRMTSLLLDNNIPMSQVERFKVYESAKIHSDTYKKLDLRALHEAMARRHAVMVNW